ncbi:hypothetical protein PENSPDRAFT_688970 [Peniophora sp. CONT]|nr:hypothetical protein PENSPDRAFT_688970 [Peniophora sp. CONT]
MSSLTLTPVSLKAGVVRDARLCTLYEILSPQVHPGRRHCVRTRAGSSLSDEERRLLLLPQDARTFVYHAVSDEKKAAELRAFASKLKVDEPGGEGLDNIGFVGLRVGDAIFCRPAGGRPDGEDDVLQVLVVSGDEVGEDVREALTVSRNELLGPQGLRTPALPVGGVGGTAFERSGYACSVDGSSRAYPLGLAIQANKKVIAPTKSNKIPWDMAASEGPSMRWHALESSIKASLAAARFLPPQFLSVMERQAELVNAPRLGADNNCLFSNVQVNIATPVAFASGSCNLADQLGHFGGVHIDSGDLPEGYSCMTAYSDLPEDVDPGQFSIFELGVYVDLGGIKFIFFTGVMYHGGSPPRAKHAGVHIPQWAYRIVYIAYPQAAVYLALGVYMIAALRAQNMEADAEEPDLRAEVPVTSQAEAAKYYFSLGSDVFNNPETVSQRAWITHPNFVQDAFNIMLVGNVITFIARSLYLFVVFILRQLPDAYEVSVDPDTFFSAFSYKVGEGRARPSSWSLAPILNDEAAAQRRQAAAQSWQSFSTARTDLIPFSIIRKKTREDLLAKGKRAARVFGVFSRAEDLRVAGHVGRPASSFFQPVRMIGPSSPANQPASSSRTTRFQGGNARLAQPSAQGPSTDRTNESDPTASVFAGTSAGSNKSGPSWASKKPHLASTPAKRTGLRSSSSQSKDTATSSALSGESSSSDTDLERPRKKARIESGRSASEPGSLVGSALQEDDGDSDCESITMSANEEDSVFEEWLSCEVVKCAPREPCNDVFSTVLARHCLNQGVQFRGDVLVHPWHNPLNRSRFEATTHSDYVNDCAQLPSIAADMFSPSALLVDVHRAHVENRKLKTSRSAAMIDMSDSVRMALQPLPRSAGVSSLETLTTAWKSISRLRAQTSEIAISRRSVLVAIMSHDAAIWARVESLAAIYSQPVLPAFANHGSLAHVNMIFWSMVRAGECARTVDAAVIYPGAHGQHIELSLSPGQRAAHSTFERQRIVYLSLLALIAKLVGIDNTVVVRLRSWLVWAVVDVMGYDGLYHANVWKAWQRPHQKCLPRRLSTDPTLHSLVPCILAAYQQEGPSTYPLSLLSGLASAAGAEGDYMRANSSRAIFESASFPSLAPVSDGGGHSSVVPEAAHVTLRVLAILSNLIGARFNSRGRCQDVFSRFTMDGKANDLTSSDKALLEKAGSHGDLYLSFRAFTPSYLRVMALFNERSAGQMTSTLGLRNVALSRIITFGSPFLLSGKQNFCSTLEAWFEGVEAGRNSLPSGQSESSFFVYDRVYGRNAGRTLDIAEDIWSACEWPEAIAASRGFKAFWQALHSGVGPSHRFKIPQVGSLLALLIAGDYCMAGHLDEPSVEEMGYIIHKIHAGGVAGLVHLGFLSESSADSRGKYRLESVQGAFRRYYEWSTAAISLQDQARWRWNVITAENHLCKDSRLQAEVNAVGK